MRERASETLTLTDEMIDREAFRAAFIKVFLEETWDAPTRSGTPTDEDDESVVVGDQAAS